ncbi:4-alpha-glucanotransferase [Cerasicoccus arenae]|uniref:4-alpha-glucanotransferase n=1 Tax=Cerasicoccus arenae TaxID=424488 RepID=A0A8J3DJE3_9BACT|nr:4-alpha-glucanotransferase [Cerasicoccus arenae]MBK1857204.1 4-alpha-glucanotransferase [Cerasicoccus arenae]GHB99974.1 4-alpha-glucanotransferase [Cerasicoccus arenae]
MKQAPKLFHRDCGLLLHPTSLPNDYGAGDFGPCAHDWIHFLADHGQNLWQILPLNPAGYGDSPYQGLSAFAANPIFLSPEYLHQLGLIDNDFLDSLRIPCGRTVEYQAVYENKHKLSVCAALAFVKLKPGDPLRVQYEAFLDVESYWLEDFAVYSALKSRFGGKAWAEWPLLYRDRDAFSLSTARRELAKEIERAKLEQFLLYRQWEDIRETAQKRGIRIIGDLPIFIAHDSVDVWRQPNLFRLNRDGSPAVMAGVPPDYFCKTGQLWGNPLYDWDQHRAEDFAWWRKRFSKVLSWVDIVRIDHFRGFEAFWEIPGSAKTAIDGAWVKAPGEEVLEAFVRDIGLPLPVIAEDLGVITSEVTALRDRFFLPGIRVEQFAFGTDPMKSTFLPEAYDENCVAYTGTHDNDTVAGWFHSQSGNGSTRSADEIEAERVNAMHYFGTDGSKIHQDFIRRLYESNCAAAIVPVQDLIGLGSEARMNTPGQASGSWRWRLDSIEPLGTAMAELSELTISTKRGLHVSLHESVTTK